MMNKKKSNVNTQEDNKQKKADKIDFNKAETTKDTVIHTKKDDLKQNVITIEDDEDSTKKIT